MVTAVESDLEMIVNQLKTNPDFRHFMVAPYTSRDQKLALLDRAFGPHVSPVTMQLIKIMLEKRREREVTAVYDEYVILRRAHEHVAHATITSAEALDSTQQQEVVTRLGQVLNQTIEPEFTVDPNLIGGIRVTYGNFVLDGSVRGALGRMKETLRINVTKQQA